MGFGYTVTDTQGNSTPASVALHISPVNDAPTAMADEATVLQDESVTLHLLANDSDLDNDPALNQSPQAVTDTLYVVSGSITDAPAGSTVSYDAATDLLHYTPPTGTNGDQVFHYTLSDGHTTSEGTITIHVTPTDYSIALSPVDIDFGEKEADYTVPPAAETIRILNRGNKPVTISQAPDAADYDVQGSFPVTIPVGGTASFTVRPKSLLTVGTYSADLTVQTTEHTQATLAVTFDVVDKYCITATAGSGGSITPAGQTMVQSNQDQLYRITPNSGYHILDVTVNGISMGPLSRYTFTQIRSSQQIKATFAADPAPVQSEAPTSTPTAMPTATATPKRPSGGSVVPSASPSAAPSATILPEPGTLTPEQQDEIQKEFEQQIGDTPQNVSSQPVTVPVGSGSIRVWLENQQETLTATLPEVRTLIESGTTAEQQQAVLDGGTLEIVLDVTPLQEEKTPKVDRDLIQSRVQELAADSVPGLRLGTYLDLSLRIRVNGGDWNHIPELSEPIPVTIEIPEKLRMENVEQFVLRSHQSVCTLIPDEDDNPDTLTISSQYFSTYALVYRKTTPCLWHWLVLLVLLIGFAAGWLLRNRRKLRTAVYAVATLLAFWTAWQGYCRWDWPTLLVGILVSGILLWAARRKDKRKDKHTPAHEKAK